LTVLRSSRSPLFPYTTLFRSGGLLVERDGECRLAVAVGVGKVVERLAHRLDFLVRHAERIAREARTLVGRFDDDFAFELEFGRRRAVEIATVDGHLGRICLEDALRSEEHTSELQ